MSIFDLYKKHPKNYFLKTAKFKNFLQLACVTFQLNPWERVRNLNLMEQDGSHFVWGENENINKTDISGEM